MKTVKQQDFLFKTKPYEHQAEAFEVSRDSENFALLMEMGTGKTKVSIDTAAWLYSKGRINFMLVTAPNDVQRNWIEREIPTHMPDWVEHRDCVWSGNMKKADWDDYHALFDPDFHGLRIMAVNFEQFSATVKMWNQASPDRNKPRFGQAVRSILNTFNTLFVVDESSKIKTPGARRTQRIINQGDKALYRRILTGTLGGPLEAFSQFQFLDPEILGYHNYYGYKHHFAEWQKVKLKANPQKGRKKDHEFEKLTGYKNLDELQEKIKDYSFRVLKKDCLDLPDKIYMRRHVTMSKEQRKLYDKLKDQSILELQKMLRDGRTELPVTLVLTKYLRLQQIIGGWLPDVENPDAPALPIFKNDWQNPRIAMLENVVEENMDQKIIIWARFRAEIEAITKFLNRTDPDTGAPRYGGRAVSFYGGTSKEDRKDAINGFQGQKPIIDPVTHSRVGWEPIPEDEQVKFFVANPRSGGYGLTLTAATCVIYYSNIFGDLEARLQSEDRCHRIGQTEKVLYVDLEAEDSLDQKIMANLLDKKELADLVVGDDPSTWF